MVNYRRNKLVSTNALYFLTIVTHNRSRLFRARDDFVLVWRVMQRVAKRFESSYLAWALLPDHLHWLLRPGKADFSKLVFSFKRGVGFELKKVGRFQNGQKIWQDRFWEHTVRDEEDLWRCVDYIHYNPVKHGLVDATEDWPYSSFRGHVKQGNYPPRWGEGGEILIAGAEWDA